MPPFVKLTLLHGGGELHIPVPFAFTGGAKERTAVCGPVGWIDVQETPEQISALLHGRTRAADYYPSHEALVDLVQLWAEHETLTGGGPGWQERFRKALAVAHELTRREP